MFVGLLAGKVGTRSMVALTYLDNPMLVVFGLLVLANLNFPGSLNFIAELFILTGIVNLNMFVLIPGNLCVNPIALFL